VGDADDMGAVVIQKTEPSPFDELHVRHVEAFAGQAAAAIRNAQLFRDLRNADEELIASYDATILGWSAALEMRDHNTEGHTVRVTEMCVALARAMGFTEAELIDVRRGALLHDIGKMGVPDGILLKPERLSDAERDVMNRHPQLAHDLLVNIPFLKNALDIPYSHHERWNGSGYPRGLKGEQIPLVARVFSVVDVWDALTHDRPYHNAWSVHDAMDYVRRLSGVEFDPHVVEVFLSLQPHPDRLGPKPPPGKNEGASDRRRE
jgi:putative nucleotidyltransferase with HDIG domain